jgi:hypothetical protein
MPQLKELSAGTLLALIRKTEMIVEKFSDLL